MFKKNKENFFKKLKEDVEEVKKMMCKQNGNIDKEKT